MTSGDLEELECDDCRAEQQPNLVLLEKGRFPAFIEASPSPGPSLNVCRATAAGLLTS